MFPDKIDDISEKQVFRFDAKKKGKVNVAWKSRHFECDTEQKTITYYGGAADIANGKKPKGVIQVKFIAEADGMLDISDQSGRIFKLRGT